jgi:hypothetical protein
MTNQDAFDGEYYNRYYKRAGTRVHSAAEIAKLCTGVVSLIEWWKHPLESVLDVGAGVGHWRRWFSKRRPKVAYRSTEFSAHACRVYGHEHRDITRWRAKERFDLVVCQGVLPYLDDEGASRAIENLAAMTKGFLYLEAITRRDLREVCDNDRTDIKVYGRTGTWYRARLSRHLVEVGCGLWCRRDANVLFYELEAR